MIFYSFYTNAQFFGYFFMGFSIQRSRMKAVRVFSGILSSNACTFARNSSDNIPSGHRLPMLIYEFPIHAVPYQAKFEKHSPVLVYVSGN